MTVTKNDENIDVKNIDLKNIYSYFTEKSLFGENKVEPLIKALLLLILSVCGNYLAETLGCQTQRLLDNMYIKNILILFMIYFTIDFTDNEHINPFINILKTVVIWILFKFFTHMNILPTVIVLILIMILLFISNYRHYLLKYKSYKKLDEKLRKLQYIIGIIIIIMIIIYSSIYYIEKRSEYLKYFEPGQYIMGVNKCKNKTPNSSKIPFPLNY